MFESAIREYFNADTIVRTDRYELKVKLISDGKRPLSRARDYRAVALLFLSTNEIPFQEIADYVLLNIAQLGHERIGTVRCDWFVCSTRGGIYLHEALDTKENASYKMMKSRFCVINSESGTVSFGPGHAKNMPMTDRFASILAEYRQLPRQTWINQMNDALDECVGVVCGKKTLSHFTHPVV